MTVKDTLRQDANLAGKVHQLLCAEDDITDVLNKGEEVPAEMAGNYQNLRAETHAHAEELIRKAETAEADELDSKLIDAFDNEEAKEVHASNQTETLTTFHEIYNKISAKEPVTLEFLGSQAALDTKRKTGNPRARQHVYKPTPNHYAFQEQALVPEETYEQLIPAIIAVDYSKYGGKDARDNMQMQAVLARSTMELVAATGTNITTQSQNFPDLTTFAGSLEQSRDAHAPMTRANEFNVWQTPGNVAKREISTIKDDGAPTWDTIEGAAPADSNPEFEPIIIYCKQLLQNSSFSRWADWDDFLSSLPNEIRKSVAIGMWRELNDGLTTGAGANPTNAVGAPKGVLKAADDHKARYSIPDADVYIKKAKGTTNPFDENDVGDVIDLMDDGVGAGSKVKLMAHKRFFGDIRKKIYMSNPGSLNVMQPVGDLSRQDRSNLIYGSFWMESALNNSAMSVAYNTGNTNHCLFIDGDQVLVRYLPLMVEFNTSRISDSRRIAVEATSGGWCEITASGAKNASSFTALRSNA